VQLWQPQDVDLKAAVEHVAELPRLIRFVHVALLVHRSIVKIGYNTPQRALAAPHLASLALRKKTLPDVAAGKY
jgi:hypothetical protein